MGPRRWRNPCRLRRCSPDRLIDRIEVIEPGRVVGQPTDPLAVAGAIDAALGPVYELGIDLGVLQDGTVRLIEVNGMPLKVSLQRLGDPWSEQRIWRVPVHYAAWLDIGGNRP